MSDETDFYYKEVPKHKVINVKFGAQNIQIIRPQSIRLLEDDEHMFMLSVYSYVNKYFNLLSESVIVDPFLFFRSNNFRKDTFFHFLEDYFNINGEESVLMFLTILNHAYSFGVRHDISFMGIYFCLLNIFDDFIPSFTCNDCGVTEEFKDIVQTAKDNCFFEFILECEKIKIF